jgi:alanyl-tRNA synthetase
MQGGRIFSYDVKKNWWSRAGVPSKMAAGEPGGPDSEMFYDFGVNDEHGVPRHTVAFGAQCHPNCDCGRFLEIGNSVFMEYKKRDDGEFEKLAQQNVDFGGGLERITAASNGDSDVFKINTLFAAIKIIEERSGKSYGDREYIRSFRIIADHVRASVFMIADGVIPSNSGRGYILRRLIRRGVRHADKLGLKQGTSDTKILSDVSRIADCYVRGYMDFYPELKERAGLIYEEIEKEEQKFREALRGGLAAFTKAEREFDKAEWVGMPDEELPSGANKTIAIAGHAVKMLPRDVVFDLYQTYGLPMDLIQEMAKRYFYRH